MQFLPLTDQQKATVSPEEQQAYELKHQEEQRQRSESGFIAHDTLHRFDAATGQDRWQSGVASAATRFPRSGTPAMLGSERLTGAALDRLTHRCQILETTGESYRLQDAKRRRQSSEPRHSR